jgi:imidazolonepropionase-like amidohydrolase
VVDLRIIREAVVQQAKRLSTLLVAAVLALAVGASETKAQTAAIFEGARLITGDGSTPVEDSAVVIEAGRITAVGRRGEVRAPAGAARVDLSGKTVIPALVDAHSHIGYMRNLTSGPQNYTRENILDHMQKFAYFGVAASMALGSDFGDLPFELRDEIAAGKHPTAARFVTAGRGIAPPQEIRDMRHSAYRITNEEEARAAVRELAARKATIVKTWVDSRGGTIPKLEPALYAAIIDEAHKNNLRVTVHATALADVKALVRANVDGLAHMVGNVDDELVDLLKSHPNVYFTLALGGLRRQLYAPWLNPPHHLISETVSPEQIKRLQDRMAKGPAANAPQTWERLSAGVKRLVAAGVRIGVGTDGGGQQGDQFIGWTMHAELENMVAAGMTPAQVLVAATRTSAGIVNLDELGGVAPGKSADFVVLDANPLDDITNTRRIARVYLRGQELPRAAMAAKWQAEFSQTASTR